ncbi:MAG TPA: HlyD family efflux transporter periplasmic adaptor subunit [Chitinophagaceae bacterium]|nr:HlyD family efflux transporter periplasmic adaptor subunit [Chitinophagaceae bacterium]
MRRTDCLLALLTACFSLLAGCRPGGGSQEESEETVPTVTPVTLTHPSREPMAETVDVNAVSAYLLKTYAKAPTSGYLETVSIHLGEYVRQGQVLFVVKTKEAQALGNTISRLDSSLHFQGTLAIRSPGNGFITQLTYTTGNYVQEGEQLAEITDAHSFVFLMDLPYELTPYLPLNHRLQLILPDSTRLDGQLASALPVVDSVAQTQRYVIRVPATRSLPANLIAKVRLVKKQQASSLTLPKAAVLSDESQTQFWIMQLINDSTAVRVPVQKGLEAGGSVQILSPVLTDSARILLTGNYGLPDTARVVVAEPGGPD